MKRGKIQKFVSKKGKKRLTLASFPFVGAGSTPQGKLFPVSERHDEALCLAFDRNFVREGFRDNSATE